MAYPFILKILLSSFRSYILQSKKRRLRFIFKER
jgi:hypothetical protein